jgi:large subunit ribosomal protein L35
MKTKIKSKSSAAKRFSFTKTGKVKRKKAFLRHILTKKSNDVKRRLRKAGWISAADLPVVKKMLPYK